MLQAGTAIHNNHPFGRQPRIATNGSRPFLVRGAAAAVDVHARTGQLRERWWAPIARRRLETLSRGGAGKLTADPENEYFSDGMAEELINALTRLGSLKVAARTSSFAFKNRDVDLREVGRVLGVSTVLEGSVRHSAGRLRVTARGAPEHGSG